MIGDDVKQGMAVLFVGLCVVGAIVLFSIAGAVDSVEDRFTRECEAFGKTTANGAIFQCAYVGLQFGEMFSEQAK